MSDEGEDDDSEKEHEPSQKRLDDARKKGDVPRSADLASAGAYGGLVLGLLVAGPGAVAALGSAGMTLLGQADRMAPMAMAGGRPVAGAILASMLAPLAPLFLLPMGAALLAMLAQRAIIFTPDKLEPKLSRISPIATLGQKFGREGLFEFAKSLVKMIVVCVLVAILAMRHGADVFISMQLGPAQASALLVRILVEFLVLALLITLVFGGADYGWQWLQHRRRNRMSRQDMIEEHKESDGDPHMKGHRRQRGRELAMNQMLQDVAKADVVIVNPTHYAVALKWKRGDRTAPICVAKGVDDVAARIREKAAENGIPIHRDPPTARAIHASVEVGAPIRPEHFKAVAAAIRFSEAMRKKARAVRR